MIFVKINANYANEETAKKMVELLKTIGVNAIMEKETTEAITGEKGIWDYLLKHIGNEFGVAGLMGNLCAESALRSNNLQNSGNNRLNMTDEEYTAAVDSGSYANFVRDSIGYGLAQWTYWSRKKALYDFCKSAGTSIADKKMQLDFLVKELKSDFKSVWNALCNAQSVREASDVVLNKFEMPADLGVEKNEKRARDRASYGQKYYDEYESGYEEEKTESSHIVYEVKKGDNLSKIAEEFGVSIESIVALNGISNPDMIYAGQTILIS